MPRTLAPLLLALLLPSTLLAGDDPKTSRTIALPREGLSVTVPAGWTFDQYGEVDLVLEREKAVLWIGRPIPVQDLYANLGKESPADSPPPKPEVWSVKGARRAESNWVESAGGARFYGNVATGGGSWLAVAASNPEGDRELRAQLEAILASLDVTAFEHPERHVDWKDGWTIDLPSGWVRAPREGDAVRFTPEKEPTTILAVRKAERAIVTLENGGDDARRAKDSFRMGTDPGGRAAAPVAEATDRFDGDAGPKVVFALPEGWTKRPPASRMRVAEYALPGEAECVVFWFGGGDGGGFAANLERWKGQFQSKEEPKVTEESAAPGIAAKVVDIAGTYVAETSPGSGVRVNKPGFRMLAAVLTTPDGPLYAKLLGPEAAVAKAEPAFRAWLRSFRPKS
jgi:hypothetical protein